MKRQVIAANWKMNGNLNSVEALTKEILRSLPKDGPEVIICPPFVYLDVVHKLLLNSPITIGAQNASAQLSGAYTGEVSANMLKDFGCRHVILGHCERRHIFEETNTIVANKFAAVCESGLMPILCIGETASQREAGLTQKIISEQISAVIDKCGIMNFKNAIIAYEPVWAIGTGNSASPEQAEEVHAWIRSQFTNHSKLIADSMRLLYGGSVNPKNAKQLFNMKNIDGGLIGGASLHAQDFIAICQAGT